MDLGTLFFLRFYEVINGVKMLIGQDFIGDLPQPLGGLQLRGLRWLKEQMDTVRHHHAVPGMPSRLIQHQDQVLVRPHAEKLRAFAQRLAEHLDRHRGQD